MPHKKRVAMRYIDNSRAAYSVDWYMTKRCNFSCSYCAEYLHDNYSESPSLEKMKLLVDIIGQKHYNNVLWSLTGGEPMVIPHFQEILKYIAKSDPVNISITTNGSVPLKKYIEAYENGLDNITLSMHFEHIENRIDEYIEKIIELENFRKQWNKKNNKDNHLKSKRLVARFMAYPGAMPIIEKMHNVFLAEGIEKIEFRNIRPQLGIGQDQMPTKKLDMTFDHSTVTDPGILHSNLDENKVRKTVDRLKDKTTKSQLANQLAGRENQWYTNDEKHELNEIYKKV
jgi:molybdenum cofactor biosynthesis enzyme MoaA